MQMLGSATSEVPRQATRVRIYVNDGAQWHGRPLQLVILDHLRKSGAAGASVFRGVAGFGVHQELHTTAIEVLSGSLPLLIEWIDTAERVQQLLPEVSGMVTEGLITVEPVAVVKYAYRQLRPIDAHRTVAEVMTREVVTVHPETPVRVLVELLVNQIYRALPVVDQENHLAGIVTNGDLVERGGLRVRTELLPTLSPPALDEELRRLEAAIVTAGDIMTREVATVRAETDLDSAGRLMATRRLKRLPVVDAEGRVVGIVSRSDILRSVAERYPLMTEEAVAGQAPASDDGTVGAVMARQVPVVHADASLPETLDAVISTRLNRAVVVDHATRPIGVVTDAEVMRRLEPAHHPGLAQALMRRLPFVHPSAEERQEMLAETGTRAADLMIAPPVTVRETTPIAEAARRMLERRYKILPVVDDEGRLVGLVDRADLLRAVALA